jgi:hypothetical protein
MKRAAICCAAAVLSMSSAAYCQKSQLFRGEISDNQCASNVHSLTRSHQEMLKSKSMGGTANTCSVFCVQNMGGYLVLSSDNDVFRLDRLDLVHGFEGKKVKVTGVLDAKAKQIHVVKIELQTQ